MKNRTLRTVGGSLIIATVSLACTLLSTTGSAQTNPPAGSQALQGAWLVQVTLRDCTTGASLSSFNSLVTFHAGGTLSEDSSATTFAVGQRSSGHGTWTFDGRRTYTQRFVNLITFDTPANLPGTPGFNPSLPVSPGFFAGYSTVTHAVELADANHGSSSGTNVFYRANGTSYRNGCSTAVLTRFE